MSHPSSPSPDSAGRVPPAAPRLAWVDDLRTLVIVLVVNMHACVTYSHVGSWYLKEEPAPALPARMAFIFWQAHLQAFFMGLLFFLAGVFAHDSLARRGAASFLRERGRRLGLPALLFMAVLHPLMVFVLLGHPRIEHRPPLATLYGCHLLSLNFLAGSGPMWFALALLGFCVVLGVFRAWQPAQPGEPAAPPSGAALVCFGAGVAAVTFLVRLAAPLGTAVLNFQLGYFGQYFAAFAAGVAAGRRGWLLPLAASRRARVAGWGGLLGGPLLLGLLAWLGGPPPDHGPNLYNGGWNLCALGLAAWEQAVGISLGLGLLAWFAHRGNAQGRFAAWLSERAFAVYVLHAPVLVALTPAMRPLGTNPFLRTAALTACGLLGSFLAADLLRRLPGLRRVL